MKKISDRIPNFFNERVIDDESSMSAISIGSLRPNKFYLGWSHCEADNSNELQYKFNLADGIEVGEGQEEHTPTDDRPSFYKSPYSKYNYRFEDGYHLVDTIPVDHILESKKDKKVLYKFNSEWFRSDHFKKEHDGLHILFTGCSNTEGVGANIEDTWSHMLYTYLSKSNKVDGYYNLAKSGSGWHTTIQNFMVYVDRYGAPDYLFMLNPNILRYFVWNNNSKSWQYSSSGPDEDHLWDEHKKHFPTWVISFKLFLKYCDSIGTKVLWSTWDFQEINNIERTQVFDDTFFRINPITNQTIQRNDYYSLLDRDDAGNARDGHDGYIQQYYWFDMFKEEIKKRKILKDVGNI
jgi:hypothetical protein